MITFVSLLQVLYSPPVSREVFKSGSRELSALEKEKTMSPVPDAGKNKMVDSIISPYSPVEDL